MKTFLFYGLETGTQRLIVSVRGQDIGEAAKKLRGEIVGGQPSGSERLLDNSSRGCLRGWCRFQPSGDTAECVVEAKRGGHHDPFDGEAVEYAHLTIEQEARCLKSFDGFMLVEIPCIN